MKRIYEPEDTDQLTESSVGPHVEIVEGLRTVDIMSILRYEVCSSWWAPHISHPTLQSFAGWYYGRKARRKYRRYIYQLEMRGQIVNDRQLKQGDQYCY